MLMSLPDLVQKYNMTITGVMHLGAHLAEEAGIYDMLGIPNVWWVEANPKVLPLIRENLEGYPKQHLIHGLVYSESGVSLPFNVTNYDGMSSSIYEFGTHPQFSPDTVFVERITLPTTTVDKLVGHARIRANFLNMDLQGAELHALKGAKTFLKGVDYIMTEVNREEVYLGCAKVEQLEEFLEAFDRVETYWVPGQGWGDGMFIRRSLL